MRDILDGWSLGWAAAVGLPGLLALGAVVGFAQHRAIEDARLEATSLGEVLAPQIFTPLAQEDPVTVGRVLAPLGERAVVVRRSDGQDFWSLGEAEAWVEVPIARDGLEVGSLALAPRSAGLPDWLLGLVGLGGLAVVPVSLLLASAARRRWALPLARIRRRVDGRSSTAGGHPAEQAIEGWLAQHSKSLQAAERERERALQSRRHWQEQAEAAEAVGQVIEGQLTGALVLCDASGEVLASSVAARDWIGGEGLLTERWRALDPSGAKRLDRALSSPDETLPTRLRTPERTLCCDWSAQGPGQLLTLTDPAEEEQLRLAALHRQGWVRLLEAAVQDPAPVRAWAAASRGQLGPIARPGGEHPREIRALARRLHAGAARWGLEDVVDLASRLEEAARGGRAPARLRTAVTEGLGDYLARLAVLLPPVEEDWVSLQGRARWLAQRVERRVGGSSLHAQVPDLEVPAAQWEPLEAALWALLDNAIKHATGPGGLRIHLRLTASSQNCEVSVSDDGPGVDWSAVAARACDLSMPHIGEHALGEALWAEGLSTSGDPGSGLALVRDVIRQAQGEVVLHSEPGEGTRVTLTLPPITVRPHRRVDELGAV